MAIVAPVLGFTHKITYSLTHSASWRLDGVSRPARLLPSGSCPSGISLLLEVLRRGRGLPISRSLFRPFDSSASVHSRHGPDFVDYASSQVPDLEVPQRLACPWVLVPGSCTGEGFSPLALPGARCPGQPGEKLSDSNSDLGLPGDAASDASFEGFPNPQTCPEARISRIQLRLLSSAAAGSLASAVGGDVLAVVDHSGSRLQMRSLQLRLNSAGRLPDSDSVSWDASCLEDLRWWSDESHLLVGLPLGLSHPSLLLFTDASDSGWGASLGDEHMSGLWSLPCSHFSINHRELLAMH